MFNQIMKMIDAGFTKDDILAMAKSNTFGEENSAPSVQVEKGAEKPVEDVEKGVENVGKSDAKLDSILSALSGLTKAIQMKNINSSSMGDKLEDKNSMEKFLDNMLNGGQK